MTSAIRIGIGAAVAVIVTAPAVPRAFAQTPLSAVLRLDVPYLPQSEALCGGAAVAMLMRYWGATGVYAETFAPLVSGGGIRGEDLIGALHQQGWVAESFRGDAPIVQRQLTARRPVIVLLQDRPGRFHYVVVVGWHGGRVIVHDPARAPDRLFDETAFIAAWRASGFWSLVVTPGEPREMLAGVVAAEAVAATARPVPGCGGLVDEGVRLAVGGDLEGARRQLDGATMRCPDEAAPWRERAGLSALRGEWHEAADDARRATARDPADRHAWRILATSLFLDGDQAGALAAWNHTGEPTIDIVNIRGLARTRYNVVSGVLGLDPGALLSVAALERARRQLAELPAAQATRVVYRPGENGLAQVDAVVVERPLLPSSAVAIAGAGVRLLIDREASVSIASPTGGGELVTAAWRWGPNRPMLRAELSAPSPAGGVWSIDAFTERQAYADVDAGTITETRRGAGLQISNWTQGGLRWEARAGVDDWLDAGKAVGLSLHVSQWLANESTALDARVGGWAGDVRAWTASIGSEWQSADRHATSRWTARGGASLAGAGAPRALWSGAGTGQGRDVLLRAHPLLDDGIVRGAVFGRTLVHGGLEWQRHLATVGRVLRVSTAVFVDMAKASGTSTPLDARAQIDAGVGLRIGVPGAGVVRVDVARGVGDGASALSVGWVRTLVRNR